MTGHRPFASLKSESPQDLCDKCDFGLSEDDQDFYEAGICRAGYCVVLRCPQCGHEAGSFGPVGCPACSPYRSPSLKRTRLLYRQKKSGPRRWR